MKKRFAAFLCAINMYHQQMITGEILKYAKRAGIDIFVFSCHVNYRGLEVNRQGAFKIMDLPDLTQFDGVIIAKNAILHTGIANRLVARIKESGVPAVSIDYPIPGLGYVSSDSYQGQADIIRHLIEDHHIREIGYITGIMNEQGEVRYRAYCDQLESHGIPFRPELVYEGTFAEDSGRWGAAYFLEQGRLPQAIVCGNDNMAIGVMEYLQEKGFSVPDDLLVTGFDDSIRGRYHLPALSSVGRSPREIGWAVMEMLCNGDWQSQCMLPARPVLRTSCGCPDPDPQNTLELRKAYVEHLILVGEATDQIKNMSLELSESETLEELLQTLRKYVAQFHAKSFYLCLCDRKTLFECGPAFPSPEPDLVTTNQDYTPTMEIAIRYENGQFLPPAFIPRGTVLPPEYSTGIRGNYYFVAPLHFQNCCYGYCVYGNDPYPLQSEMFYLSMETISVGLENVRKGMLLRQMVKKLNGMWVYDMLTHLYNRAGFYYYAEKLVRETPCQGKTACILFVDLDGLKAANDAYGHEAGDCLICAMANLMKAVSLPGQLLMRYGGDEFVMFGFQDEAQISQQVARLRQLMGQCSWKENSSLALSASIGVHFFPWQSLEELSARIDEADQRMYQEKRAKKKARGQLK